MENKEGSKKLKAASFSIYVNIFLIILKLIVSIMTNSLAILAELFHSLFDMLASVFAYLGIKKAEEPADKTHHFGHEKVENISSLAQTLLIVITSIFIIYEAIKRIYHPQKIETGYLGIIVMLITIAVDFFISKYLHKASSDHGSVALEADAYHFTTDLWGAISVLVGLFFVYMGFPIFDSIAAIIVALIMLYISYKLGMKAMHALTDGCPEDEIMEKISHTIKNTKGVLSFHKLRVRHAGSKLLVNMDIQVDKKMTIKKAHDVSHRVKERLKKEIRQIKDVTIHIEPEE